MGKKASRPITKKSKSYAEIRDEVMEYWHAHPGTQLMDILERIRSETEKTSKPAAKKAAKAAGKRATGYFKIDAKRWFEKTNGNTYHSVVVYEVSGQGTGFKEYEVGREPFRYGYGEQYLQTAFDILKKANLLPASVKTYTNFLQYKRDHRDLFVVNVADVSRKKDLDADTSPKKATKKTGVTKASSLIQPEKAKKAAKRSGKSAGNRISPDKPVKPNPRDWFVFKDVFDTGYYDILMRITKTGIEINRIEDLREPSSTGITVDGKTHRVMNETYTFKELDDYAGLVDDHTDVGRGYTKKEWLDIDYEDRAETVMEMDPPITVDEFRSLEAALKDIEMEKFYDRLAGTD